MGRFLSIADLRHLPPPKWLIQGLFEVGSLVMVVGPQSSFKSFLALDWSLCLASGRSWNGQRVVKSNVIYALGEGKGNLLKRIKAWNRHNEPVPDEAFRACFEVPQLATKEDVDRFLRDIKREELNPDVIVIDTLARSFVGKDENGPTDPGLWIESADRLRHLGLTVIVLHHTSKSTEFGLKYRGSTAFMGAMDTAFTLRRDGEFIEVTCSKQKDYDEGPPFYMKRVLVPEENSMVLLPIDKDEVDAAKQEEAHVEEELDSRIQQLLQDESYASDRARARDLALQANKPESWAQSKVKRARDKT